MNQADNIMDLIAKVLSGRASVDEQQQLQQWIEADPANKREFEELAIVWQESLRLTTDSSFDKAAGWTRVANRIHEQAAANVAPAPAARTPIRSLRRPLAIAASLLAVALIGWWTWSRTASPAWKAIAAERHTTIVLPDGSSVKLRKGATLQYPEQFDQRERRVTLSGEGFFEVQKDEHHPFVIGTQNASISVLGTSFLVNTSDQEDEVIVVNGKVRVASKQDGQQQVELLPGQRIVLQQNEFHQSAVADSNFIAWNTGLLHFNNTPLPQALRDLEDYYEVPISIDNQQADLAGIVVNARFDQQPLDQALEEIRLVTGLQTKKEDGKIVFYMK
ncbi:FecR domain-containing protein [Paraflavitalea pollutisoli]|uniref:FecR domain-containing protein n=1 Tax=Paraflavitalea pollutisoli TaxID=3034143 RepID=UPI0023EB1C41|nr:FecR domain-containing protein [Paraflavitalea sp. H1-2-19X]